jgi:hypothetical protein
MQIKATVRHHFPTGYCNNVGRAGSRGTHCNTGYSGGRGRSIIV